MSTRITKTLIFAVLVLTCWLQR